MVKLRDAQSWYKDGYLVDLEDVAKTERWDDIYPAAIKAAAKTDGKWSAVPIDLLRADVMWINPNVLAKVGATPPKTWDEFNAVADKLKAAGITPLAHGGQNWQDTFLFEYVVLGVGGPDFYNKVFVEGDTDAMKSPTMKAAFDQYRKLRGYVDKDFSGRDWNLATGMLIKGDAAFQMMGDWVKGEVTAANLTPGKDILCAPTPRSGPASFNWISNSLSFFGKQKGDATATDGQKLLAAVLSHGDAETAYALKKGGGVARLGVDPAPFDACGKWEIETSGTANQAGTLLPDFIGGMTPMAGVRGAVFDSVSAFFNTPDMSSEDGMKNLVNAVELAK
jgi:glucose/mannose transport system substrate-binding protein